MNQVFFPSCKATACYPASHKLLREYMLENHQLRPVGCCKKYHQKLTSEDEALILCINCERVIRKGASFGNLKYIWALIDEDDHFPFPDYHHETIALQHCHIAKDNAQLKQTIRSLLKKMNLEVIEFGEDENDHCPSWEIDGWHRDAPMSKEECQTYFTQKYQSIPTKRIISYCKSCNEGVQFSDHEGVHLLELLFPANAA